MVWPFLAVVLNQRFGLSITQVGVILSVSLLLAIVGSPIGGICADRFGRIRLVRIALGLVVLGYVTMAILPIIGIYIAAILLISLANCVIEPALRATLGELVETDQDQSFVFHLRYYLVNLSVSVGPLVGMLFIENESVICFGLAAVCYLGLVNFVWQRADTDATNLDKAGLKPPQTKAILLALIQNWLFVILLLLNLVLVFIYAQSEDPLVFHMIDMGVGDLARTIAILSFANTVTVLVFHMLFMDFLTKLDKGMAFAIGGVFLGLGQLLVAVNWQGLLWLWVIAIVLMTVAEFVVMPMITIMVDKMAPSGMRSSFFGISMLPGLGAAAAPFLGAVGISYLGGAMFFSLMAALCVPLCFAAFILRN